MGDISEPLGTFICRMTLDRAMDTVYQAFAPNRRREPMARCSHCVGQDEQITLDRTPLRDLTPEQLNHFAFNAMNTWGDATDYKHFLPRILELAVAPDNGAYPGLSIYLICGKLSQASWTEWSLPEQKAVTDCFLALWSIVLRSDPENSTWNAFDILAALARSFSDPSRFLAAWQNDGSLSSALQLADLLQIAWSVIARRKPLSRNLPFRELLQRWLTDRARLVALEHAFEQHLDHPASSRVAAAIDAWPWIRQSLDEPA